MLARRGLRPSLARPDLPFSFHISAVTADALAERLGHYAFRLFVRGVIHHGDGFTPDQPTSYVNAARARLFTETLVALGIVAANERDRYRLVRRAGSFGGTLEFRTRVASLARLRGRDGRQAPARAWRRSRSGRCGRGEADPRRARVAAAETLNDE